jgi:4-amino-4-deoxy-L-arabinose transferase-like glycosyltransferase
MDVQKANDSAASITVGVQAGWASAKRLRLALLSAILLAAAGLRLVGVGFGQPFVYHPDEWVTANPAMNMVRTGTWDPRFFLYPSALTYAERTVVSISRIVTGASLTTAPTSGLAGLPDRDGSNALPEQFAYFFWGRVVVAVLGVLTALVTYLAASRIAGAVGGLAAAAIVAVDPLHVLHSHYLTPDVPTSFCTSLTLLLGLLGSKGNRRWLVASGFVAGLAASTKYNGGLVLMVPLVLHFASGLGWQEVARRAASRTTVLIVGASIVGFVVATPAILFDSEGVFAGIQAQAIAYTAGHPGAEGTDNWLFNLRYLYSSGLGPALSALVVAGLGMAAIWRRAETSAVALFAAAYFALVSIPLVRFERNLVPLVPYLAILAGVAVGRVAPSFGAWPRIQRDLPRLASSVIATALVCVGLVQAGSASIAVDKMLLLPDTRTEALSWIEQNLPAGSRIVREQFTPQVPSGRLSVGFVYTLPGHPMSFYKENGVQYLVASGFNIDRFGAGYPTQKAFYADLLTLPIVYELWPGTQGHLLTGPRVIVVRLTAG